MNKLIPVILITLFNIGLISACDFCNCYLGLNPHSKKNNVGIRYHLMDFSGTHMSKSDMEKLGLTKDDFWETRTDIELHGQVYPTQKLQLLFSVPYVINTEGMSDAAVTALNNSSGSHNHTHSHGTSEEGDINTTNSTEVYQGIGDPLLLSNYQVFNKTAFDSTGYSHRLFAGGGVKVPLGDYHLEEGMDPLERAHLPGTGSWDFLLNANYLGKFEKTGFNVNLSYLITTENDESFEFGNKINANATMYYRIDANSTATLSLFPNAGMYFENAGEDKNNDMTIQNSGGSILYAHAGFDIYYKRISFNSAFQLPVSQSLNQPQPEMNFKVIAGISYAIN
jgi:hypothetical protein